MVEIGVLPTPRGVKSIPEIERSGNRCKADLGFKLYAGHGINATGLD
jgi:hypothetical protein